MNESCHIWMSHVSYMNESCHIWMSRVTYMTESCHMSHIWMSHGTQHRKPRAGAVWVSYKNESRHTYTRVLHVRTSHVICVNGSCHITPFILNRYYMCVLHERETSHIWTNHIYTNKSCHIYERAIPHNTLQTPAGATFVSSTNEERHIYEQIIYIRTRHVTFMNVPSHTTACERQ